MKRQASKSNKTIDQNQSEMNADGKPIDQTKVYNRSFNNVTATKTYKGDDYSCDLKFYTHQFDK